jgi:hypothetical protein
MQKYYSRGSSVIKGGSLAFEYFYGSEGISDSKAGGRKLWVAG